MNNNMNMINQFIQFRNNFKGDPKEEVIKLVQSGKMTQAQLNQYQNMATQFMKMMGNMK